MKLMDMIMENKMDSVNGISFQTSNEMLNSICINFYDKTIPEELFRNLLNQVQRDLGEKWQETEKDELIDYLKHLREDTK